MSSDVERIKDALSSSRKYRSICPDALLRIAAWAAERESSEKDAVKRAKRKLHQITGAYPLVELRRMDQIMREPDFLQQDLRSVCRQVLQSHRSTAERIDHLEDVSRKLFPDPSQVKRILDLGGGLNPFGIPWMGLDREAEYLHFDIHCELTQLVNLFFQRIGQTGRSQCRDILYSPVTDSADVALLLKVIPCLEQQQRGVSTEILQRLRVRRAVISFPNKSLGGREKGMEAQYLEAARRLAASLSATYDTLRFPTETYYVLDLNRAD